MTKTLEPYVRASRQKRTGGLPYFPHFLAPFRQKLPKKGRQVKIFYCFFKVLVIFTP